MYSYDKNSTHFSEGFYAKLTTPPKAHSKAAENEAEFIQRLETLQKLNEPRTWKHASMCKLCNKRNVAQEYQSEKFRWSGEYLHYIKKHHVRPSDKFSKWVMTKPLYETSHPYNLRSKK